MVRLCKSISTRVVSETTWTTQTWTLYPFSVSFVWTILDNGRNGPFILPSNVIRDKTDTIRQRDNRIYNQCWRTVFIEIQFNNSLCRLFVPKNHVTPRILDHLKLWVVRVVRVVRVGNEFHWQTETCLCSNNFLLFVVSNGATYEW